MFYRHILITITFVYDNASSEDYAVYCVKKMT
jgi:hypothetical protein